jgi:hypothetical protein
MDREFAQIDRTNKAVKVDLLGTTGNCALSQTSQVKVGDRFIQLGNWRLGDADGTHFSIAYKSGSKHYTAVIFRKDGTVHNGPRRCCGLAQLSTWGRHMKPSGVTFGQNTIQIGDWRLGTPDGTHFSIAHKAGRTAMIFRKDGTVHPGPRRCCGLWQLNTYKQSIKLSNIKFAKKTLQIGDWRIGDRDGTHFSFAHKDKHTAMIYRSDGTVHPGPRRCCGLWQLNCYQKRPVLGTVSPACTRAGGNVRVLGTPGQLVKNKFVKTMNLPKDFTLEFDLTLKGVVRQWASVFHFTTGNDCCAHGSRIPAMWFRPGSKTFIVVDGTQSNGNAHNNHGSLTIGKKVSIKMKATRNSFDTYIDGKKTGSINRSGKDRKAWKNVKFYMADPWYPAANAVVSQIKITDNLLPTTGKRSAAHVTSTSMADGNTVTGGKDTWSAYSKCPVGHVAIDPQYIDLHEYGAHSNVNHFECTKTGCRV